MLNCPLCDAQMGRFYNWNNRTVTIKCHSCQTTFHSPLRAMKRLAVAALKGDEVVGA